jgi:hypothetical protein
MKLCKTEAEFVEYMWKIYPNDDQLELRTAMLKSFNFLVGRYDQDEKIKLEIAEQIRQKMVKNGYGS